MNIYISCTIILLSISCFQSNGQNQTKENVLSAAHHVITPLYNGEFELAKRTKKKIYGSKSSVVSDFLDTQILRWQYIPIYDQTDSISKKYLVLLNSIIDNTDSENEYSDFIQLSAYLLFAEYYYNSNSILNASNYGRKAYSLLKDKLSENNKNNEWLLPVGLYNYFYSYYVNKNFAFESLLYFFKTGDRELGLKQLNQASEKESIIQPEALIYLSHIYLRLENEPAQAMIFAQKLNQKFPENLKFYEFYIESAIALEQFDDTTNELVQKLNLSEQIYYQKYGTTYKALIKSYQPGDKTSLLNDAVIFIELHGGGPHLLSLLYKRLSQTTINHQIYEAKLAEYKVYNYKLTEL